MSEETYLNKLIKSNPVDSDSKAFLYICSKWHEDGNIELMFQDSDTKKNYEAKISKTALQEVASELSLPFAEYYEECKSCLTTPITLQGYSYEIDEDDLVLKVWKSQPNCVPILYLDANLKETSSHFKLLDIAVDLVNNTSQSLIKRVEKAHKFDENFREMQEDYARLVEEKKDMEKCILKKAAALLNSKKQKIIKLQQRLQKYEQSNAEEEEEAQTNSDSQTEDEEVEGVQKAKRRRRQVQSESSNEDSYSADTQPL